MKPGDGYDDQIRRDQRAATDYSDFRREAMSMQSSIMNTVHTSEHVARFSPATQKESADAHFMARSGEMSVPATQPAGDGRLSMRRHFIAAPLTRRGASDKMRTGPDRYLFCSLMA